jgi:predicted GIY-YIG superfamily endonuclease
MSKQPAVYILASKRNGTLYIWVTSDLKKRAWEHKNDQVDGFSKKIRGSRPSLLRVTREHGVSDNTREADKEMEPVLEAGVDRGGELGLEGFVGRDYLGNEH